MRVVLAPPEPEIRGALRRLPVEGLIRYRRRTWLLSFPVGAVLAAGGAALIATTGFGLLGGFLILAGATLSIPTYFGLVLRDQLLTESTARGYRKAFIKVRGKTVRKMLKSRGG